MTNRCFSCGDRLLPDVQHRPIIDCTIPFRHRLVRTVNGSLISVRDLIGERTMWHAPHGLNSNVYHDPEGLRALRWDLADHVHLIGSRKLNNAHIHLPVIDVDNWSPDAEQAITNEWPTAPLVVVPSCSPGHVHVYVQGTDGEMAFAESMMRLATLGVVEPGYAIASIRRACAHVRPPWAPKGVEVAPLPPPPPPSDAL